MKSNEFQLALTLVLALGSAFPATGWTQEVDEDILDGGTLPPPVVEPAGSRELREAMRRIAVRPNDAEALFDAGNASLMLGDAAAALNFFTRASNLRPNDGRIKAGLGAATVRTENPFEALRLFDEAVKLGISERAIAVDRALAFDLLGNFERAQQDYRLARTASVSEQLVIQQAISLSLSGAKTESDNMLVPLLQRNNLNAWRARAFMLAARGEFKESTRVSAGFLDSTTARKMESYLRLMPQLTPAQQAAAMHFGHFPQSFEIGRDSAAVVRTAGNLPPATSGSGRLVPAGAPLGPAASAMPARETDKARKEREAAAQAAKLVESKRAADAARAVEAARIAELQRKEEATRLAEAQRQRDAMATAEAQRVAEAQRIADAQKLADAQRVAEAEKFAEVQRQMDAQRLLEAKQREDAAAKIAQAERDRLAAVTAPILANPTPAQTATEQKVAEAKSAQIEVAPVQELPPPETVRPLVDIALPPSTVSNPVPAGTIKVATVPVADLPNNQIQAPVIQTDAASSSQVIAANMPERPAIANAPAETSSVAATGTTQWVQGVDVGQSSIGASTTVSANTVASSPPVAVEAAKSGFDLGEVVASIEIPESEQERAVAAVDLKKLKATADRNAAKAKLAEAEKKAKADDTSAEKPTKPGAKTKEAANQPSRVWFQVATGSDAGALVYDWRRLAKKYPELFKGREGWTAAWGKSNRLVVGPFDDLKAAKKWEAAFQKAGGNGFIWTSDKGLEVQRLKSK